jgi:sulfur transfer protein SufE
MKTELLKLIPDPVERLETMMEMGNEVIPPPENVAPTEIKGCASRVYVYRDPDNKLYGGADSAIVRGMLSVLFEMAEGKTAEEIREADLRGQFKQLELNLGAGRMNGADNIIRFLES